jgi:transposase
MLVKVPEILNGGVDFDFFYSLVRKEKNPFVLRILYFIFDLYYGLGVPEASKKHRITKETGYKYAKLWRTEGIDGLIPKYNNGKPSKMTEKEINIVIDQIREGKVHNIDDLIKFILENFKINYSKSWAYDFYRELSLKDGIKYPLPRKEKKSDDDNCFDVEDESKVFFNDNGLMCVKVSKKLYFTRYEEDIIILKDLIFSEKNNKHLKRYLFMNSLDNGVDLYDAANIFNVSISTARKWLKLWNELGLDGLKIEWGEGRPSLLTDEQLVQLKDYIQNNHVTRHSEIHKYILINFNIDYSLYHIYRLVKKN